MMKKYFLLTLIGSFLLASCVEKTFDPVLQIGPAPAISTPAAGTTFELKEDNAESVMTIFAWSAADYGFDAGVDYTVELDVAGSGFSDPITLGLVNALTLNGVTVGTINNIMLTKGLPDGVATAMEVRVLADVSDDVQTVISAPVSIDIIPYRTLIEYPKLQVPGSYQGWDPSNTTTVIYSRKSDGNFEGYRYFADPNTAFKFTDGPSWDTNWGDDGVDGTLDPNGADIVAADAGQYKLNVNLNALTYTMTKTAWGLIGDATPGGWDNDTDMTFDAVNGVWTITVDLVDGNIKFRANDDWAINLGDTDGNGSMEYDGDNIPVTAGNYTIELALGGADFAYTVTKN